MVQLTVTADIHRAIAVCRRSNGEQPWVAEVADLHLGDAIPHSRLIDIARVTARERDCDSQGHPMDLDRLLRGSRVHVPPPKPKTEPVRDMTCSQALMSRLRAQEEEKDYQRMTYTTAKRDTYSEVFPSIKSALRPQPRSINTNDKDDAVSLEHQEATRQLTLIINILVSVVASGIAIFILARHWEAHWRLTLSLSGSALIAVAEVVIYNSYIRRITVARADEAKLVEVKKVVDSWEVKGSGPVRAEGRADSDTSRHVVRHRKGKPK